jgi:hypothetical protein
MNDDGKSQSAILNTVCGDPTTADFGRLAPITEDTGNEASDQAPSHHSHRQSTSPGQPARSFEREGGKGNRNSGSVRSQRALRGSRSRSPTGRDGIDVINEGEMSKPGYATYIKESPKRVRWGKCRTWCSDRASRSSRLFETFRVRYAAFLERTIGELEDACL